MSLRKTIAILLVLLLAGMVVVPMVSAGEEQGVNLSDSGNLDIPEKPAPHHIPDDYLKDSKPAKWLPESEMVNIILSQKILAKYGQNSNSDLIEIPISYLESKSNFAENKNFPSAYKVEAGIYPDEPIVLIRMPTQLYLTFIKEDVNGKLTLPPAYFCRFYANFTDLKSHTTTVDGSIQITPSSQYPVPGLLDENSMPINAEKISSDKSGISASLQKITNATTLSVPQNFSQWSVSGKALSTNYKYCIGRIRPYSWTLSGSGADLFKLFAEREYKFNNGEALEIIVQYFDRNELAGIELYPALYRNGAAGPILPAGWSHWEGHVAIDPFDLPHSYGYHVQTTNSGYGYQVDFEDMDTQRWIKSYTVTAASTVSSFTELDGSSEYNQINVPSTDTFSATTSPVIDEWVIDVYDGWNYPINAWQEPVLVPAAAQPYVSVVPSWDSTGRLITESYAHYP
ncbi:hypothetical protein [Methanoregula sp.]|uniref:hypothetical protein n=1 Tax=Methanoregula sp. TaxID=2052170 RepID=UPI00236B0B3E|nr:hypothetical protein [Methanoregula sp.]MDD1686344.1 hypothetical protein [Methanoregula sp.]